eukprot:CAMPEP_0175120660 /NCGR_PEP_ID=MMETSP0087-20121206/741_1 /TAXON_ID=136419 /ORGANISM="Unknown Unknown, Strain D1" /LENGTH=2174 /DNA_ID=CAMNT_0016402125 /DNA_START=95 /DNA_END=6619 /DNA_ORIENTATION=+
MTSTVSAFVGVPMSLDCSSMFTDPENDVLAFSLIGLPVGTGLAMSREGLISGTPTLADALALQPLSLTVSAVDPFGHYGTRQLYMSVAYLPSESSNPRGIMVDLAPTFGFPAGEYTYTITGLPKGTGLAFNSATAQLTGFPSAVDNRTAPMRLTVTATRLVTSDEKESAHALTFELQLLGTNFPPTAGILTPATVFFGQDFEIDCSSAFSDPDGDRVTYTLVGEPMGSGFHIDSETGRLYGAPTVIDVLQPQPVSLVVSAYDGHGHHRSATLYLTVIAALVTAGEPTSLSLVPHFSYIPSLVSGSSDASSNSQHYADIISLASHLVSQPGVYTYRISGLANDTGLVLDPHNGALTGTPTLADAQADQPISVVITAAAQAAPWEQPTSFSFLLAAKGSSDSTISDLAVTPPPSAPASAPTTPAPVLVPVPVPSASAPVPSPTALLTSPTTYSTSSSPSSPLTSLAATQSASLFGQPFSLPFAKVMMEAAGVQLADWASYRYALVGLPADSGLQMQVQGDLMGTPALADVLAHQPLELEVRAATSPVSPQIAKRVSLSVSVPVLASSVRLDVTALLRPVLTAEHSGALHDSGAVWKIGGLPAGSGLSLAEQPARDINDGERVFVLQGVASAADRAANPLKVSIFLTQLGPAHQSKAFSFLVQLLSSSSTTNLLPVSQSIFPILALLGTPFRFDLANHFYDPEGEKLTFSLAGLSDQSGLSLQQDGTLTGIPSVGDALASQPVSVSITATDSAGNSAQATAPLHVAVPITVGRAFLLNVYEEMRQAVNKVSPLTSNNVPLYFTVEGVSNEADLSVERLTGVLSGQISPAYYNKLSQLQLQQQMEQMDQVAVVLNVTATVARTVVVTRPLLLLISASPTFPGLSAPAPRPPSPSSPSSSSSSSADGNGEDEGNEGGPAAPPSPLAPAVVTASPTLEPSSSAPTSGSDRTDSTNATNSSSGDSSSEWEYYNYYYYTSSESDEGNEPGAGESSLEAGDLINSIVADTDSIPLSEQKNCSMLGWSYQKTLDATDKFCGSSTVNGSCSGEVTYSAAAMFCERAGAHVCHMEELVIGVAAGTGCELDNVRLWTGTVCPAQVGAADLVWLVTMVGQDMNTLECAPPEIQKYPTRCCGRTEVPVVAAPTPEIMMAPTPSTPTAAPGDVPTAPGDVADSTDSADNAGSTGTPVNPTSSTSACSGRPCLNQGQCQLSSLPNVMGLNFTCLCPTGYGGVVCEQAIREALNCTSERAALCQNGAQCRAVSPFDSINTITGIASRLDGSGIFDVYDCDCPEGFSGLHCAVDNKASLPSHSRASTKTCEELGWEPPPNSKTCSSSKVLGKCSDKLTLPDALLYCSSVGARLCTSNELTLGYAKDQDLASGCNLDSELVWSGSACDSVHALVQKGGGASQGVDHKCASSDKAVVYHTRCCADTVAGLGSENSGVTPLMPPGEVGSNITNSNGVKDCHPILAGPGCSTKHVSIELGQPVIAPISSNFPSSLQQPAVAFTFRLPESWSSLTDELAIEAFFIPDEPGAASGPGEVVIASGASVHERKGMWFVDSTGQTNPNAVQFNRGSEWSLQMDPALAKKQLFSLNSAVVPDSLAEKDPNSVVLLLAYFKSPGGAQQPAGKLHLKASLQKLIRLDSSNALMSMNLRAGGPLFVRVPLLKQSQLKVSLVTEPSKQAGVKVQISYGFAVATFNASAVDLFSNGILRHAGANQTEPKTAFLSIFTFEDALVNVSVAASTCEPMCQNEAVCTHNATVPCMCVEGWGGNQCETRLSNVEVEEYKSTKLQWWLYVIFSVAILIMLLLAFVCKTKVETHAVVEKDTTAADMVHEHNAQFRDPTLQIGMEEPVLSDLEKNRHLAAVGGAEATQPIDQEEKEDEDQGMTSHIHYGTGGMHSAVPLPLPQTNPSIAAEAQPLQYTVDRSSSDDVTAAGGVHFHHRRIDVDGGGSVQYLDLEEGAADVSRSIGPPSPSSRPQWLGADNPLSPIPLMHIPKPQSSHKLAGLQHSHYQDHQQPQPSASKSQRIPVFNAAGEPVPPPPARNIEADHKYNDTMEAGGPPAVPYHFSQPHVQQYLLQQQHQLQAPPVQEPKQPYLDESLLSHQQHQPGGGFHLDDSRNDLTDTTEMDIRFNRTPLLPPSTNTNYFQHQLDQAEHSSASQSREVSDVSQDNSSYLNESLQ